MSFRSGTGRVVTVSNERCVIFLTIFLSSSPPPLPLLLHHSFSFPSKSSPFLINVSSVDAARQILAEPETEEQLSEYARLSLFHDWNIRQLVYLYILTFTLPLPPYFLYIYCFYIYLLIMQNHP